jgi:glycosyltransferase involved in cell wall biosynthesis
LKKITFITWALFQRRSELLAQHLKATAHFIYFGHKGNLLQAPVRFPVQAWRTWRVLRNERPDVVFVQNPPIFCALVACLYARCYGARYVIDSHTGAFLSPKWRWSVGLHRILSRGALTTIVHNESQGEIVGRWACRYLVLGFTPIDYPAGECFPLSEKLNVAVVSSFEEDEPIEAMFEAAGRLPDVTFYVTGDPVRVPPHVAARKPENCRMTGFLPYDRYLGLLRGVDVVIVLTTSDHTLLAGGFEAVSFGKPLIVSDWPILRRYFSKGTVHIPNTVEGICEGVRRAQREQAVLRRDILLLRERLQSEWERNLAKLQNLLQEG